MPILLPATGNLCHVQHMACCTVYSTYSTILWIRQYHTSIIRCSRHKMRESLPLTPVTVQYNVGVANQGMATDMQEMLFPLQSWTGCTAIEYCRWISALSPFPTVLAKNLFVSPYIYLSLLYVYMPLLSLVLLMWTVCCYDRMLGDGRTQSKSCLHFRFITMHCTACCSATVHALPLQRMAA